MASSRRTTAGKAFCCFLFGSSFLKDLNSLDKNLLNSPSLSLEGFGLSLSLKVCTTCAMILPIVLSANVSLGFVEKCPWRRPMANAPSNRTLWLGEKESRKGSDSSPTSSHHSYHLFHALVLFSCVALVTAFSAAASAEEM